MSKLPDHQKDGIPIQDSIGRMQNTPIVYEGGIYRLIFGSKLPNAIAFTDLVTDVILPTIRQTGSYSAKQQPLQLPEKASSKEAVIVLQEIQTLVEQGEFDTELPLEKREKLKYCLQKTQGFFTGRTFAITTGRKDEFGRLRLSEYPDDEP
jgi:prophage antirepressor-like protein